MGRILTDVVSDPSLVWILFASPRFVLAAVAGLLFGSFANACIHRWPLEESVARGRSRCPHCRTVIRWHDNIPVLSWIALMGRCRACRGPISPRYPAIELLAGAGFGTAALLHDGFALVAACAFLWALIVCFWIDYDYRILPDEITLPFAAAGFFAAPFAGFILPSEFFSLIPGPLSLGATAAMPPSVSLAYSLLGWLVGGGLVWIVRVAGQAAYGQEAMGFGDVKFMAFVGAWFGPAGALKTFFGGAILGGLAAIILLLAGRAGRRSYIPFGPFLAIGAAWVFFGAAR